MHAPKVMVMHMRKQWPGGCGGSGGDREQSLRTCSLRAPATYRYTCRIACRDGGTPLNHVLRTHDTMMRMSLIATSLALVIAASAAIAQDAQTPATEAGPAVSAPVAPAPAADAAAVPAPAPVTPATLVGDASRGKGLTYTCRGCHGVTGYKNAYPTYHVPKLGGQSQVYLHNALTEYRQGKRKHPTMQAQSESFSEQDIADIAAYLSSIK